MKLKKLMLIFLLTTLPIMTIFAQQSAAKNQTLENEFGIDLNKTYTGSEVNEIINIILEEADKSIEKAYAEGYKQATLEYKPYTIEVENPNKNNSTLTTHIISFSSGLVTGILTTIIIDKLTSRQN